MAETIYRMHPRSLYSGEAREKEARRQPLAPAHEQEKPWKLVSNNIAPGVADGAKA